MKHLTYGEKLKLNRQIEANECRDALIGAGVISIGIYYVILILFG